MVPIMAAIPPARTRSLRAAAPSLNRHQQSSNNASSTTMATATATRRTQAGPESSIQGPSPLSLFMTNLRLLDLDLLPDWPGISAATFSVTGSGTGAAQAQKRRVICVEWALFRLFEIYDAEETRTVSLLLCCLWREVALQQSWDILTSYLAETQAILSTSRAGSVCQSARCLATRSRSSEEERGTGQRYDSTKNDAG